MALSDGDRRALISGLPTICQEAIDLWKLEDQATSKQRKREVAALEFQVPEKQWPDEVRNTMSAQVVNGVPLPPRVMLSIPTLDQPIQLVLNQERAAQLAPTIHPISEDADDDTAEVIQGLYRHIDVDSRANLARTWAFERAVKAGRGMWRVLTEFDPDGGHPSDQKIVIKRLLYQEAGRLDPYAQEPDWSDADWGMVATWMPLSRFKRHWPKAKRSDYTDGEFSELMDACPDWFKEDKYGKAVLVVEYFRKVFRTRSKVALVDGSSAWEDEIEDPDTIATGEDSFSKQEDDYTVMWSTVTATDELTPPQKWEGRYIPLIPTIGRELVPFDDERRWTGIIEPNMDAVRMCNYGASGIVQAASLEPKAPFDIDPEEIAGLESFWQQANVRNFPYLPRHKFKDGHEYPQPGRHQADMSKMQMNALVYQHGIEFIHTGTGAWEATLGQQSPSNKTKGGIQNLQQQHEQGNSNWLDNLAQVSLTLEAKIVLDLIPKIYDRPGRVVRIVTGEGDPRKTTTQVMLNKPFITGPNGRPRPAPAPMPQMPQQPGGGPLGLQQAQPKVKHFDLTKGKYGVVVTVGKAYQSRVQEGSDRLGMILQADPQLVPILGPNWLHFQDFPGHKEAEEILLKMRDHAMPWLRDQDEPADPAQQLAQAQAQIQQMQQMLQQAGMQIQTKQIEQQGKLKQTALSEQAETDRTKLKLAVSSSDAAQDREVKLAVAELGAKVDRLALFLEERARVGAQAHDVGMAAQAHAQAMAQQAAGGAQDAALADQGHQQALEQQSQAAALAPEPSTNGQPA